MIQYTYQHLPPSYITQPRKIWTKGNYRLISDRLAEFDWAHEFAGLSTQRMYSRLLKILDRLIEQYIPVSNRNLKKPPWTLNPPRDLVNRKSQAFARFKTIRHDLGRSDEATLAAWRDFIAANVSIKQFARKSQEDYEVSIVDQIKSNPKLFHAYLRHRRVGRPSIGPLKRPDGTVTDDPAGMATLLAASFVGVFESEIPNSPADHQASDSYLPSFTVTPTDVLREVKSLDVNSSMGIDGVHPRLLSRCASSLSIPLSLVFNSSLREAISLLNGCLLRLCQFIKKVQGPTL